MKLPCCACLTPARRALLLDLGLLLHRLAFGGLMLFGHGLGKLQSFSAKSATFPDPLHLGHELSMASAIGAEFGCSLLVILGLATRVAVLPLLFTMGVAALVIHAADPFRTKELAVIFAAAFAVLFFTGPGRYSLDALIARRRCAPPRA